jgi:hypothetical protein
MGFAVLGALGDRDPGHGAGTAPAVPGGGRRRARRVVLPLAIGTGALVRRDVPAGLRGIVQSGLFSSARRWRSSGSPQPRGLLAALADTGWLTVAVLLLIRTTRGRVGGGS